MNYSELRARFIAFHSTDKRSLIDFDAEPSYYDGQAVFPLKTFEEYMGLERLGGGAFSDVYDLGNGKVLKVTKERKDAAYHAFIEACKANGADNPVLPRVHYMGVWADRHVYILDKLTPLEYDEATFIGGLMYNAAVRGNRTSLKSSLLNPSVVHPLTDEACQLVGTIVNSSHDFRADFNSQNMMLHPMGHIVITDPIAG